MFVDVFFVGVVACLLGTVSAGPSHRNIRPATWPAQHRWTERLNQHASVHTGNKVRRGFSANRPRALSSSEYVTVYFYDDTDCTAPEFIMTYGTGICTPVSDANNGASSFMYNYFSNSSVSAVDMTFYSDDACTNYLEEVEFQSLGDFGEANATCLASGSTSSQYVVAAAVPSFPSSKGFYIQ
jgi:hypothetical protein